MTNALASISLTLPAMLGGLALLSLPVLAHLLNRRARRTVVFPSVALLVASSASHSALFKLRRWILLLLRCLAVALLVLAFAQPLWQENAASAADQEDGAGVVLLIDVSASVAQRSGGVAASQTLHAAASRTLDAMLVGSDMANIVYASARPHAAFPKMTANLEAVRNELNTLAPTYQRADLPAALALAGKMLAQQAGDKHLVILTDLQATNWADLDTVFAASPALPRDTRITLVPSNDAPPSNLALSDPAVHPFAPILGRPAQLSIKLSNFGDQPRAAQVRLIIDGKGVGWARADLQPWEQREVSIDAAFDSPGEHRVSFTLEDSAMDADNTCRMVVRSVQRVPVVVIGDDPPQEPGSASYFLTRALSPRDSDEDLYLVRHLTSAQVAPAELLGVAAVFLSDIGPLSDDAARALHDYMLRGGAVVMFGGSGPVAENLAKLDAVGPRPVAPWPVGPRRDLSANNDPLRIIDGLWQTKLLEAFDPLSREALALARFKRIWPAAEVREDARILLRFSDGAPAMGDRAVGDGSFIFAGFNPALADGDLSKYGSFVALVHHMTRTLQPRHEIGGDRFCGLPAIFIPQGAIDPGASRLFVTGPDDQLLPAARVTVDQQLVQVVIEEPDEPGFYAAVQDGRVIGQIAVNVDPRESDLRRVEQRDLVASLQAVGLTTQLSAIAGEAPVLNLHGLPLWGWMILAAMVVLGVEMMLLGHWKR